MTATPDSKPTQPDPFANSPDPLIDEVREARRRVWEQHGNDMRQHMEALRKLQQEWGAPIIADRGGSSKRAM